jgi:hypothetical protein
MTNMTLYNFMVSVMLSVNRSQMAIKRKTSEIQTWKKHNYSSSLHLFSEIIVPIEAFHV